MKSPGGYAGVHSSIFDAIYFLNHLQAVDSNTMDDAEMVCAICQGALSDPEADRTWHQLVRLPSCGHVFGKSCLFSWLTPFDHERQQRPDDNDDDDNDNDNDDDDNDEASDDGDIQYETGDAMEIDFEEGQSSGSGWTPINAQPAFMDISSNSHEPDTGRNNTDYDYDEEEDEEDYNEDDSSGSDVDEIQCRRSTWLPEKTAYIDKSVSFTHILVDRQTPNRTNTDQHGMISQSYSLWDHLENAETRLNNLAPGNNRCPYCRNEVFAQPACVDSLLFLSTRIRVWDTAYELLAIQRRHEERYFSEHKFPN
ncbi:MAG: hypothetical protein Q9209_001781 [Squamulea sp. 1 TL-2023]